MSQFRLFFLAGLSVSVAFAAVIEIRSASAQEPAPPESESADDPFAVDDDRFLLREPETVEEFFNAALQAQRLARPNLARLYLQRFLELDPTDEQLLALRDEYGPAAFARLANQPELRPLSSQLADRVTDVFRERGASPERVIALLDALGGPPAEAFAAREALINAGEAVIPQVVLRLQRETNDNVRQRLLDVLAGMGEEALPALHAGLNAPNDVTRLQMISVISRIGDQRSIPHLYFSAYGPSQPVAVRSAARAALVDIARVSRASTDAVEPSDASRQLRQAAVDALRNQPATGELAGQPGADARVWSWDAEAGTVVPAVVAPRDAALLQAARLARESFLLAPERDEAQALYLAILMESEARQAGSYEPPAGPGTAFNMALAAGPEMAAEVLRQSSPLGLDRASVGALGVIAQTGSPSLLFDDERILGNAINSPSSRVQLAAAVAILRLDPRASFAEASRVVEVLSRSLSDASQPTAVIIDPNAPRGSNLAGFARQMGFGAVLAATGQEGFTLAAERVNPAFVMVNLNVSRWPLSQTLANLRADARTRQVPIFVIGPQAGDWQAETVGSGDYIYFRGPETNDPRSAVRRVLSNVDGTVYVVETTTAAAFAAQVRPALSQLSREPLSEAERDTARAVAAFWLAQIADTRRTEIFPLTTAEPALVNALSDPNLAENALIALGAIPTTSAQRAIADFLLAPTVDGEMQATAAAILADHVRRYGLSLPAEEIRGLDRLRETTNDPALQTTLTAIQGAIGQAPAQLRQRLEALPSPQPATQP